MMDSAFLPSSVRSLQKNPPTNSPPARYRSSSPNIVPSVIRCCSICSCCRALFLTTCYPVPSGSCCITTSTPHSHYHKKHPTKSRSETSTSSQRRDSNGTKRPMEPPQLTPGGDLVATPHGQSVSEGTGLTPLKRCGVQGYRALGHPGH